MEKSQFQALREQWFSESSIPSRLSESIASLYATEEVNCVSVEEVHSGAAEEDKSAAATKIQAIVKGYSVRRRTPLIHLRKIYSVKQEFSMLQEKVQNPLEMEGICSNYTLYTNAIENLLSPLWIELDALQGVHPDVRDFQQSVIHDLIEFQEVINTATIYAGNSWINNLHLGHSNSIAPVDGVSDSSLKRMRNMDDKWISSEQSYKRQHFDNPQGTGKAPDTPIIQDTDSMTGHSPHVSFLRSSIWDRKGKGKAVDTPVTGDWDNISQGEVSEFVEIGSSSNDSSELSYEAMLDFHSERGLLITLTAVVVIQSTFRGYKVRRLQPLKHLREIADARAQLKQLTNQLSSSEFRLKLRYDMTKRLKVTDCIAALLLHLESVLAVDKVVQDIRESVAMEVADLQQLVDTLTVIV